MARSLFCALLIVGGVFAAKDAIADDCAAYDVDYALTGTLRLVDTPFGKANGTHKVGPGRLTLRFEKGNPARVTLRAYEMRQSIAMTVSAFLATIHITADSTTRAKEDACGVSAEGVFKDNTVQWSTPVHAVRTDGTVTCSGKYCGTFGAPEPGSRPIQLGPSDMRVRALDFSKDGKTFTMPFTLGAKTESPKQTSFLALTGREVKRTCVAQVPACKR